MISCLTNSEAINIGVKPQERMEIFYGNNRVFLCTYVWTIPVGFWKKLNITKINKNKQNIPNTKYQNNNNNNNNNNYETRMPCLQETRLREVNVISQ